MKKRSIIVLIVLLVLVVGLVITGVVLNNKKDKKSDNEKTEEKENSEIVTTITIDVNPSIEINLDKDNKVVSVVGLNEDSEKILEGKNFKGNDLEEAIDTLVESLVENGYLKESTNTILINVETTGKIEVEETVNKIVKENKIECEVIVQEVKITEEIKKQAEEYNMTPSKYYYIKEQIKDEKDLKIEDFKDVSVDEVKDKIETHKEENKQEEPKKTENNKSSNGGSSSGDRKGTSLKSHQDLLDEGMLEPEQMRPIFFKKYGISGTIHGSMFNAISDSRCKYNNAYEVEVIENLTKHTAIMCSFDELVFDYKKTQLVSSVIGEDSAYQIALNTLTSKYGFDSETITEKRVSLGYNNTVSYLYEYSVYIATTMSGQFVARIKATNGDVIEAYKW